ncbi:MAG: hypothetical protein NZ953_04355 [Thaumarchaeota archaeon]|nr:hypothetical protein [Candidatus Calditenuaceae archaeon]
MRFPRLGPRLIMRSRRSFNPLREVLLFRGFFAKVMVRDIAATFFTYVERDTLDVIERRFLMLFKRRETEPRQELIPVAVVHDSDWHGAVIRLAEVGLPAFGNLEQAIGVLNRVAKLASEKVVELHQAEVNTLRSLLDESLNLVQNTSDIQILVRGMRIYEAKGELTPPRKIKWSTILIATLLGVGIVLLILLIFMRWGS